MICPPAEKGFVHNCFGVIFLASVQSGASAADRVPFCSNMLKFVTKVAMLIDYLTISSFDEIFDLIEVKPKRILANHSIVRE